MIFFQKKKKRPWGDKTNAHLWTVWVRPLEWCTWSPFLFSDECVRRRQQHFPTRAREHSTMNFSNAILQRPRELVVTSFDNCKFIDELFAKRGDKSIQSNIWNNSAMILIPDPKRGDNICVSYSFSGEHFCPSEVTTTKWQIMYPKTNFLKSVFKNYFHFTHPINYFFIGPFKTLHFRHTIHRWMSISYACLAHAQQFSKWLKFSFDIF